MNENKGTTGNGVSRSTMSVQVSPGSEAHGIPPQTAIDPFLLCSPAPGEAEAMERFRQSADAFWEETLLPRLRECVAVKPRRHRSTVAGSGGLVPTADRSGALSAAYDAVVRAFAEVSRLEDRARLLCVEAVEQLGFTLAAYQDIDSKQRRLETIAGDGEAVRWVGVASHPVDLDPSEAHPRDIQAHVAATGTGQVIRGRHPLLDPDLFNMFGHAHALRAFLPVGILRHPSTGSIEPLLVWQIHDGSTGLEVASKVPRGFVAEVIGTLEVGYLDGRGKEISRARLHQTMQLIAGHAKTLYDATLKAALERAATEVMRFCGAESASLHLFADPRDAPQRFTFNVVVGRATSMATLATMGGGGISAPPRSDGLGALALSHKRPRCVPDQGAGHARNHLKTSNPTIWHKHSVRTMAALPLVVDPIPDGGGVLYVHYFRTQFLAQEMLENAQSLVERIAQEVRVARERRENGERRRQMSGLVNLLLSTLTSPDRCTNLREVARNARAVLGADLLCFVPHVDRHWSRPSIAGWPKQRSVVDLVQILAPIIAAQDPNGEGCFAPDVREGAWLGGVVGGDSITLAESEGIRSAVGLSLRNPDGELRGVMYVGFRTHHSLQEGEAGVIRLLGRLATAILVGRAPSLDPTEIGCILEFTGSTVPPPPPVSTLWPPMGHDGTQIE